MADVVLRGVCWATVMLDARIVTLHCQIVLCFVMPVSNKILILNACKIMLVTASPRNWALMRRPTTLPNMWSSDQSKSLQVAPLHVARPRRAQGQQTTLSLQFEIANGSYFVVHLVRR